MKEREDEIEDLFRERFSTDEAPLSPKVWENIKQTLPEKNGTGFLKGPLLSTILALIIAGAGWGLFRSFTNKEEVPSLNKIQNRAKETDRPDFALTVNKNSAGEKWQTPHDSNSRVQEHGHVAKRFISENELAKNNTNESKPEVSNSGLPYSNPQGNHTNKAFNSKKSFSYNENGKQENTKFYATNENAGKQVVVQNRVLTNNIHPYEEGIKTNRFAKREEKEKSTGHHFPGKDTKGQSKLQARQLETTAVSNDLGKAATGDRYEGKEKNTSAEENDQFNKRRAAGDETNREQGVSKEQLSSTNFANHEQRVEGSGKMDYSQLASGLPNSDDGNTIELKSSIQTKADSVLPEPFKDTLAEKIMDSIARPDTTTKKEKTKEIRSSRWSVDVLLAPALTGVASKAENSSYEMQVASKNSQSKNSVTLSGGLAVNYSFGSNWSVSTGLFYSAYSEKYNFKNTVKIDSTVYGSHIRYDSIFRDSNTVKIFDSIAQTVVQDTTVHSRKQEYSAQKKDRYSFLSFPVNVSYCFLRRHRITLSATAGIKVNVLLKSTTYISNKEMTDLFNYQWSVQKVTLSYMASLSMEYVLWKNISLLAQPVVNYHGGSIYSGTSPIRQRPYSIGVNAGLRIRF